MGEPGFAVAEAIKKLGARFQDTAGIGCVLPKAGKRRDGARMSGANGSPSFCQFQLTFVPRIHKTTSFPTSFSPVEFSTAAINFSKIIPISNIFFSISLLPELRFLRCILIHVEKRQNFSKIKINNFS